MLEVVVLSVPNKHTKIPNNSHWLSLCNPVCPFATHYNDLQPATSNCNLPLFCIIGGVVRQEESRIGGFFFCISSVLCFRLHFN